MSDRHKRPGCFLTFLPLISLPLLAAWLLL